MRARAVAWFFGWVVLAGGAWAADAPAAPPPSSAADLRDECLALYQFLAERYQGDYSAPHSRQLSRLYSRLRDNLPRGVVPLCPAPEIDALFLAVDLERTARPGPNPSAERLSTLSRRLYLVARSALEASSPAVLSVPASMPSPALSVPAGSAASPSDGYPARGPVAAPANSYPAAGMPSPVPSASAPAYAHGAYGAAPDTAGLVPGQSGPFAAAVAAARAAPAPASANLGYAAMDPNRRPVYADAPSSSSASAAASAGASPVYTPTRPRYETEASSVPVPAAITLDAARKLLHDDLNRLVGEAASLRQARPSLMERSLFYLSQNLPHLALADWTRAGPESDEDIAHPLLAAYLFLAEGNEAQCAARAEDALRRLDRRRPLRVNGPAFASRIDGFRDYVPRAEGASFAPGEALLVYLELEGLTFTPLRNRQQVRLKIGLSLVDAQDREVWSRPDYGELNHSYHGPFRDFHLALRNIALPQDLRAGAHTLRIALFDLASGQRATAILPVEVGTGGRRSWTGGPDGPSSSAPASAKDLYLPPASSSEPDADAFPGVSSEARETINRQARRIEDQAREMREMRAQMTQMQATMAQNNAAMAANLARSSAPMGF